MSKHQPLRPEIGQAVHLADYDPDYTGDYEHKKHAREQLKDNRQRMRALQDVLYAEHKHTLLIILQALRVSKEYECNCLMGPQRWACRGGSPARPETRPPGRASACARADG